MSTQIKPLGSIAEKWNRRASSATQEYTDGVGAPRKPWAAATQAAEGSYEQGVQASISRKAFGKGVAAAGDAKWSSRAKELGSGRYASGVAAGQSAYQTGFTPYFNAISNLSLPPRGAKGSPANLQRVAAVATALRNVKTSK
jgi:hypothetical protein